MHDYFRLGRLVSLLPALFITAAMFGCATTQNTAPTDLPTQAAAKAERVVTPGLPGQTRRPVNQDPGMVTCYRPPDRIDLCGEPVPLEDQDVLERFDREFSLVVYNHAQVYWWLKRKERYFPQIEERLRRLNLPEDLKYVALVEIEPPLNPREKRKSADTRYDFRLSPDGAFQYLGDLYRNFRSWPLAIAAYTCGVNRIVDESSARGERNFYHMALPQETERYVFRILAIKAVLSNPTQYGYQLPGIAGYR